LAVLQVNPGAVITLIGAGGKTTTLAALAREVRSKGWTCVITTTTKIWPVVGVPTLETQNTHRLSSELRSALDRSATVAIGRCVGADGKLHGVPPELICRLAKEGASDIILVEGDGAAGRPLKAHGTGEPVVPGCSTCVLLISGIDAVGAATSRDSVHRLEDFCRISGAGIGEPITPRHVALSLEAAASHVPLTAVLINVLNKVDDQARLQTAELVVSSLAADGARDITYATSWGRVVGVLTAAGCVGG
jgi:probable selenium-dependent hydroxylase accessory protein YqeC